METKGIIRNVSEVEGRTGVPGHVNMAGYKLLNPEAGESVRLSVRLDVLEPNDGSIDPHDHKDKPVFDHAFYVAAGRVVVKLGDGQEKEVGEGTLVYVPSHLSHSFRNVGKTQAKILAIASHPK